MKKRRDDVNAQHRKMCELIAMHFISRGKSVKTEVLLPLGKGAIDIVVYNETSPCYIEVKSHPTSVNDAGLRRQIQRYEQYFPGGTYCCACPTHDSRIALFDFTNKQRIFI